MGFERTLGRAADALRPVTITRHYTRHAEGSVLIEFGHTKVLCTASVEDRIPPWLRGSGKGWVTAEYSMLPRSGRQRNQRDLMKPNGRSMEIQRLIGRTLRTAISLEDLGERTITLDCDALRADGGTRCAAITAGYVATYEAVRWMLDKRMLKRNPMKEPMAAVSVGVYRHLEVLDLNYDEDSSAHTDMNLVMTESGKFVEIQGTAEQEPFGVDVLAKLLKLGQKGINELIVAQKEVLDL
jgi:ribonuclease PH